MIAHLGKTEIRPSNDQKALMGSFKTFGCDRACLTTLN